MCATWNETDEPIIYDGLGPDEFQGWPRRDVAWSIAIGVAVGVVLVAGLWFLAVWTVKS